MPPSAWAVVCGATVVGLAAAQPASVSAKCRIADLDFSRTGTLRLPGPSGAGSEGIGGWSVAVCTPSDELCPKLGKAYVQVATCASNTTDSYSLSESFVRTPAGAQFNFTTSGGTQASVDVACDAALPVNTLGVAAPATAATTDRPLHFSLASRCACPGGCGVASTPKANPECGFGAIDLSAVEPLTFSATKDGADGLWQLSPCGQAGAICPATPSFLASQSDSGDCNDESVFDRLLAFAALPNDGGVVLTFSGDGVGTAVAAIKCDPSVPRYAIQADTTEVLTAGYGDDARWSFNFSSQCACPGLCPRERDFWAVGPGQRTNQPGKAVDYPAGYPGRTAMPDGSHGATGISMTQCHEACDKVAPGCSAFSYSQNINGTCHLYASAGCDTSTTPGWNWTTFFLEAGTCQPGTRMQRQQRHRRALETEALKDFVLPGASLRGCSIRNGTCSLGTAVGKITSIGDAATCCALCAADPKCRAFTLLANVSTCVLQVDGGPTTPSPQCASGTTGPPVPPPPPPPPVPPTPPPTPDNCSVAGMHFTGLPPIVKFTMPYAHDTDPVATMWWQLSLCAANPSGCGGAAAHLIGSSSGDCSSRPTLTFPTLENFTMGDGGADFLLSGPTGLAMVSVVCDTNSEAQFDLSPTVDTPIIVANGTSPSAFVQLTMQSRCACPGGCGPKASPTPVIDCHVDGKNFSITEPATFALPANLTDGWSHGRPTRAPVGLRGEADFMWSLSPCRSTSAICANSGFLTARPQNATWCADPLVSFTTLESIASRKNFVVFTLGTATADASAIVAVACGVGDASFVPNAAMNWVEVSGAGTGKLTYSINVTSSCACDGSCVPHLTRPYHSKGDGQSAISPGVHVDYPSDLPGASFFNGTSCGRGISQDDCARACDAAPDPGCDSYTFASDIGLCFLFRGGSCDTYATPGTTSQWISTKCPSTQRALASS